MMDIECLRDCLRKMRHRISFFLTRPYGGMEVEMLIGITEISQAMILFFVPAALWQTRAFQDLAYWGISPIVVAIPWLVAGTCSWVGIIFAFFHYRICAPLRWVGSFLSTLGWGWVAVKTGFVVDWSIVYVVICFLFSFWSIRISGAAFSRWDPMHYTQLLQSYDRL